VANRQPRRRLTQARVLDAAQTVADRDGLAALTMRNLAAEVGVEAMSLYHHFRNKDALLDALADRVFAELPQPSAALGDWRSFAEPAARNLWAIFQAHPWAAELVASRPLGPTARTWVRELGRALEAAGWRRANVRSLIWLLQVFVIGAAIVEAAADSEASRAGLDSLPADVRRYVDHDASREFGRGLSALLDGAEARFSPKSG
jgi:AcrR family transcriptional regulator